MLRIGITSSTARMAGALVLMLALVPAALSQTTTAQESDSASSDIPEEIIVYGKRSLVLLRKELYTAEEKFFAVFNTFNSDDDFDVECDYVFRIQAHRRVRECKPVFLKNYLGEIGAGWFNGTAPPANLAVLRRKERLLVEEMQTQVSEHPELLEMFTELAKAKHDYDSERQSRRN